LPKKRGAFPERAERVRRFIECLIVPSGVGQGGPLRLRRFQRKFIQAIYEPHTFKGRQWRRVVRRAILSIARKNGKTALIAALVLVHLCGPEAIPNGEIYSAANEREQAAQVFKVCQQMIAADPELRSRAGLEVIPSTKTIICRRNGSVYRAISAEAGTKMGLNPSVVVYDELAQSKNRALYDALDSGMGAREEPLFIVISTQSNDPQHILSQLIDDGLRAEDPTIVCHLYAVPDDAEDIFDEAVWPLANPALDDFRSLEDMRAMAQRASRMPSFEASFRNLYLNQRVDAQSPLIPRSEWEACKVAETLQPGERVYLGLDLSATTDLTALVACSADDGDRIGSWFWKPGGLVKEHELRDRAPYTLWKEQGWLRAPPGKAIDYGYIAEQIAELSTDYDIVGLAYDRWRIKDLMREFDRIGLRAYADDDKPIPGALRLVSWGQGFRDMSPAIDALEISILQRRFAHNGNPVLNFCIANAQAVSDPAGNRKLDKSATRFRIDGAVATAMAVGLKARDLQRVVQPTYQMLFLGS
jgi:phage terminase large subunit-like protein